MSDQLILKKKNSKPAGAKPSWKSDTEAKSMLKNDIKTLNLHRDDSTTKPQMLWKSRPEYMAYSLENFRNNFNNMKKKVRKEEDEGGARDDFDVETSFSGK